MLARMTWLTRVTDFSGRQAFDLYLKCLQLILRHQVWFLVHERGLPAELETVIFDLWALRIAQLGEKIVSDLPESDSQSQVFNTLETDDDETTDIERGLLRNIPGRRDRRLAHAPNLKDCLALCYLGMLTLRLPLTPGDIYAWVTDGKMAHRGAIKLLPLNMRDRLPPAYHSALYPNTLLNYRRFYNTVTNLQISFAKDHGIAWPALNVPLLLYRYLKELALPLELYDATTRLGELLGLTFAFDYDGKKRLGIRHLPEAQLIGCLIVCTKLLYPFDEAERHPKSSAEPTATAVDWESWYGSLVTGKKAPAEDEGGFTTEELLKVQEKDVFQMAPDQMDQYLDFFTDTFLDNAEMQRTKDNDDFRNALYTMFPIEGSKRHPPRQSSDGLALQEQFEQVKTVHSSMKSVAVVNDEAADADTLRPGQNYEVWKRGENLPERAKSFYEQAAKLAGLSMDMIVLAVFFTEARIEQWRRRHTKARAAHASDDAI